MSKRQSAVEYIANEIGKAIGDMSNNFSQEQTLAIYYALQTAKRMERENIEEAFNDGDCCTSNETSKKYYTENYEEK